MKVTKPAKLHHWHEFTAAADAFVSAHPGVTAVTMRAAELVALCDRLRQAGRRGSFSPDGKALLWRDLTVYPGEHDQAEVFEAIPTTTQSPAV